MLAFLIAALAFGLGQADAGAPAAAAPPADEAKGREQFLAAIERMQQASARLKDFTATFHKREYKGRQRPWEVIDMKFRASPRSVYMKWVGANFRGQEVLWQRDRNKGNLTVHTNTFPDFTVHPSPDSWIAMRNTRHPTQHVGFEYTLSTFARDIVAGRAKPHCVKHAGDLGVLEIYGKPARCYESETDKAACPEMYAYKARICESEANGLPAKVDVWDKEDGELRLVEEYGYEDIKVDVGLGDKDFDPKNRDYGF